MALFYYPQRVFPALTEHIYGGQSDAPPEALVSTHTDLLQIGWWILYTAVAGLLTIPAFFIGQSLFWSLEFHWYILTRCQDKISDFIRLWRFGDNTKNLATQLPPEILLAIFEQLRLRSRFGTDHGYEQGKILKQYSKAYKDLVPATCVCTSWNGPASAILYRHVVLLLGKPGVDQFARTIQRRPELLLGMRGLHFDAVYGVPKSLAMKLQNHTVLDLLRDERCPQQVTLTTSFADQLEEDDGTPSESNLATVIWNEEVLHLLHRHSRVQDLGIIGDSMRHQFGRPTLMPRSGLFHSGLSNLQTLRLIKLQLRPGEVPTDLDPFLQLRSLFILDCKAYPQWLTAFVDATPALERLELIQGTFYEDEDPLDLELSVALAPVCENLLYLYTNETLGMTLGHLNVFTSLRSIKLELQTVLEYVDETNESLPAKLEVLIVNMPWRSMRRGKTRVAVPPRRIFGDIQALRAALPSWFRACRRLRFIELWDTVSRGTWKPWEVISFLWTAELERQGITLSLNLNIHSELRWRYEGKFERQRRLRRLHWVNVI